MPQTAFVSNQKQQALNFSFTKVRGDNYLEKIERRLKVFRKDNLPKLSVGLFSWFMVNLLAFAVAIISRLIARRLLFEPQIFVYYSVVKLPKAFISFGIKSFVKIRMLFVFVLTGGKL